MNKNFLGISPSLICMDLCNLEKSVIELENLGFSSLHIDLIDGYFSPSMPIGIDIIKQIRRKTNLLFDAHITAKENSFFIKEFINIGVERICFHIETELHIAKRLDKIKLSNIEAGIALTPASSFNGLEYILEQVDFILLMCINPGFASTSSEKRVPYALKKVKDLSDIIEKVGKDITITVDGRIYSEDIKNFVEAGADTIVGGTSNIFRDHHIKKNYRNNMDSFMLGMNNREIRQLNISNV